MERACVVMETRACVAHARLTGSERVEHNAGAVERVVMVDVEEPEHSHEQDPGYHGSELAPDTCAGAKTRPEASDTRATVLNTSAVATLNRVIRKHPVNLPSL